MPGVRIALLSVVLVVACDTVESPENDNATRDVCDGPYLEITVPRVASPIPAIAPPIATYRWQTITGMCDPDSVRWILVPVFDHGDDWDATLDYIRDTPDAPEWSTWHDYHSHTGTWWTTPPLSFMDGPLVFAVQAKMAGGAASREFELERNARRVRIPSDIYLRARLTGDFIEPITSSGLWTPMTFVDVPAGTPVAFCWTAYPGHDFEDAMTWRYGWDIGDIDDDSQWDTGFIPFDGTEVCAPTRWFPPGSHTFHLDVMNASGFIARVPVTINSTPLAGPHWFDIWTGHSGSMPNS